MVDGSLPIESRPRPLRYLFLDLNAYFASVEQQERPELRGRAVAVVPLIADTTFIIAASYEAKARGVKTLMRVDEAKRRCPEIELVQARGKAYVAYHRKVIEAAETVLPVDKVCSIDEMRFRLLGSECEPENALRIAQRMKQTIREMVGDCMKCSVGLAPNAFLAKVATELQKPDGLVMIEHHALPNRLHGLQLTDFPGINRRMQARLHAAGIFTTEQMCAATRHELRLAFGSVVGERWWYLLRGIDLDEDASSRKSLSHSHVLAPDLRTDQGTKEVMLRLLQKASARMRSEKLFAERMSVAVKGFKRSWHVEIPMSATNDTVYMNELFLKAWETRDFELPKQAGVTFHNLRSAEQVTPSLFDAAVDRTELNQAVDRMNQSFGKNTVYLAGMKKAKNAADEKIAFHKTTLFSEGKGDNEWVDTFRGVKREE